MVCLNVGYIRLSPVILLQCYNIEQCYVHYLSMRYHISLLLFVFLLSDVNYYFSFVSVCDTNLAFMYVVY